jgi:predicted esterase
MKSLVTSALLAIIMASANAAETKFKDSENLDAYLHTPTDQPVEGKTYWLAIGVHGLGGDGKGANGLAGWAKDDVIVLGPTFLQPKAEAEVPNTDGPPTVSYQMCGPSHETKLKALIEAVGKTWKLHPKVFLHGFSAGAQFAHRFAMKNPELVAGVSAASAGSWSTRGLGDINPAASRMPFAISCGEHDRGKSSDDSPLGRLEWMQEFAGALNAAHFDVTAQEIVNTSHQSTPQTLALAAACFQRARSVNFSRSVMVACDFNEANPLWSCRAEPTGKAASAQATWESAAGVIEKQGTTNRTGALRLRVNSAAKSEPWSGTLHTGLIPANCPETDVSKLTLAFDLSTSSVRAALVVIESFNAKHERTGGRETLIYPASPDHYQRHVCDLGMMKPAGEGSFTASDPFVQISLTISHDLDWATGASHRLQLDNLSYAAPAWYVSPEGKDSSGRGSADKPLATINKALDLAQPGDIILLMDGTYLRKNEVANFVSPGAPAAWISVKNHPGHRPVLTSPAWNLVKIGRGDAGKPSTAPALAYLELRGLEVKGVTEEVEGTYKADVGKAKSSTNGNGIGVDGRWELNKPHHLRIADNVVHHCPGGGISVIHADYVQVENNTAHHNCHWTIYVGSGISIYQPFNFDAATGGHKILVRHNIAHHNYCTQPWVVTGKPSDGNGIIIDDARNLQNKSTNGVYHGGVLVQGNLSHDNGGSGMHSFASDHIDFINNTSANNSTINDYGQLSVTSCGHVRVLNNILTAAPDKPMNRVNGDFHDVLLSHSSMGATKTSFRVSNRSSPILNSWTPPKATTILKPPVPPATPGMRGRSPRCFTWTASGESRTSFTWEPSGYGVPFEHCGDASALASPFSGRWVLIVAAFRVGLRD